MSVRGRHGCRVNVVDTPGRSRFAADFAPLPLRSAGQGFGVGEPGRGLAASGHGHG